MVGLCCGLLAIAVTSCSKRARENAEAKSAKILRLSQRNEPADLDPARASLPDEFFIVRALSEGLVSPAPFVDGQPPSDLAHAVQPAAAERWDISADRRVYTFHLRRDAAWSNGEPVTAQDFVDSYHRLLTPATGAPKAALFFMVKNARAFATGALTNFAAVGFNATDSLTLVVTLEQPTNSFLLYAASGPWIPVNPRVVARLGRDWTAPGNFVGNGPFTLTEWRSHQRIVVRKNPRYHAATLAKVDEIQFIAFDNGDTEDRAYRAGQIDVTMAVPVSKLDTYARERPSELHHAALAETRYLSFNTTRAPLNDPRVRRALALAVDRDKLVEHVIRGGHQPASRFLPPALRSAVADSAEGLREFSHDVATARELLVDAGYPGGRNFPRLELSSWVIGPPVIEAIQEMWKRDLGVDVSLVIREARVHVAALRKGDYDIALITEIPDVPDAANVLFEFASGAAGNYPHWSDAIYDALLAQANTANGDAQAGLLHNAETRLLNEAPLAPLYFNSRNWLMSSRVQNWQHDALWTRFYLNVELTNP